jgi:hypothetical protein
LPGSLFLLKNPPKFCTVLVGLRDVGICQIFYSQAVIQRTIVESPAFLEHGWAEKIAISAHTNRDRKSRRLDSFLYEVAQNFEVFKILNENLKIKNLKQLMTF